MERGYGIEAHHAHGDAATPLQPPARYLVVIEGGGTRVARLFLEDRTPVAEFDAASEEVAVMTQGLVAAEGALGPEWDKALGGHNRDERRGARIYTLDV